MFVFTDFTRQKIYADDMLCVWTVRVVLCERKYTTYILTDFDNTFVVVSYDVGRGLLYGTRTWTWVQNLMRNLPPPFFLSVVVRWAECCVLNCTRVRSSAPS